MSPAKSCVETRRLRVDVCVGLFYSEVISLFSVIHSAQSYCRSVKRKSRSPKMSRSCCQVLLCKLHFQHSVDISGSMTSSVSTIYHHYYNNVKNFKNRFHKI